MTGPSAAFEPGRVQPCPHTSWGRVADGPFVCRDCQQEIKNPMTAPASKGRYSAQENR